MEAIGIVAGEPNSISSEIIFKSWMLRKKFKHRPLFVIGSYDLFLLQNKKLKYPVKVKKINKSFNNQDLKGNIMPIYDVKYKQNKPYKRITSKSNNYIFKSFKIAIDLVKKKKIIGFINCPVYKETLFKNKYQGVTELVSKLSSCEGKEVMMMYNKSLSVCPITTHVPINKVSNSITKSLIVNKIKTINSFYIKYFKVKPKIWALGLNPHGFSPESRSEEKRIILPAIKIIKQKGINISGPVSPDASFSNYSKNKINIIVGMYHDQVLTAFKALFNFNAINITLGLPYIRVSPDHGVATNIVGKKIANPESLIESIKFFNKIKS